MTLADRGAPSSGVSRLRLLHQVNVLGAPLLIVGFVLVEASTGATVERLMKLVGVGVLGSLVLGVFLWLAGLVVSRFTWGESWTSIVTLLLLGSIPRTLTLEGGLALFGIADEIPLATRILNSLVLIPVTLGLSLRALEFIQRYRERRNHLVGLLLRGERQLSRQVLPSTEVERSLVATAERDLTAVNESLIQALVTTKALLRGGEGATSGLGAVRDQADQQWRSISHRLWEESTGQIPKMSAREFVNTVALLRPLSLGYLALGAFFLFVLALIRLFPVGEAVLWSVGWYALMALASIALNEIPRRLPRPGLTLALLLVPYVFGGAIFLVAPGVPAGQGWGAAGIHFTVALSMVLIGSGPAVSQSQDTVLAALRRLLEIQSLQLIHVESEASILAAKFAERLHSDIRGAFHARMMRLQKHIDEGALADAEKEIDALVEALREDQSRLDTPATINILLDFLSHWDGIITINHTIDDGVVPPHLVEPVTTIVMNAVNDAVRHGGAENIGVSLEDVGDHAVLRVTNDGADATSSGPDGLGHASLDRLAGAGWERTRRDGVTELTVHFSTQP